MTNTAALPQQRDDIRKLLLRLEPFSPGQAQATRDKLNALWLARNFDVEAAAQWTKTLLDLVRAFEVKAEVKPNFDSIPDSRYAVATEDGHLAFYEVWTLKSGYRGVSLQISDSFQRLDKAHAATVLDKIRAGGPVNAAKAYGMEIGQCAKCHRTLTDPESIALGIGPVCIKSF